MNERQRMQYLDAMGIDMYVPRFVLPAAKFSSLAPLPEPEQDEMNPRIETDQKDAAEAIGAANIRARLLDVADSQPKDQADKNIASKQSAASSGPSPIGNIIGELVGKAKVPELRRDGTATPGNPLLDTSSPSSSESTINDSVRGNPNSDQSPVYFSLSIWRVADRVMILDSRLVKEPLPTQALLENIVSALGLELNSTKPEILNWPMFSGEGHLGGWQQASEMTIAFLRARLEHQPVDKLWVMGQDAYGAVLKGTRDYAEHVGQTIDFEPLPCNLVVLPSLADMLKDWRLKRVTWNALQASGL